MAHLYGKLATLDSVRREPFGVRRLAGAFEVEGRPAGEKAGASSRTSNASRLSLSQHMSRRRYEETKAELKSALQM
jgi:hypothetical protein